MNSNLRFQQVRSTIHWPEWLRKDDHHSNDSPDFLPGLRDVIVLGKNHGDCADDRVSYLPEERGLYRKMKVRDLLQYYARLKGFYNCGSEIDFC